MQAEINCSINPKAKVSVRDLFGKKIYEYKWPSFRFHIIRTKDGLWIYIDHEDWELLKKAGIDPSQLTKKEIDFRLKILKA